MWFAKQVINQLNESKDPADIQAWINLSQVNPLRAKQIFEMYKDLQAEYNLEFQGSVRNLQKRALFMKFYPEMPRNNTEMR